MPDGLDIKPGDRVRPGDDLWAALRQLGVSVRRTALVEAVEDRPAVGDTDGGTERYIRRAGRWGRAAGFEVVR
jgi:hypothetical protein